MLPNEILSEIVQQLDLKSLMALSETTVRMHKLIKTDNLLWKRNLKRDFGLLMQRLFPRSSADCNEDYAASFHQYKLKYILLSGYHGQNQHLHPVIPRTVSQLINVEFEKSCRSIHFGYTLLMRSLLALVIFPVHFIQKVCYSTISTKDTSLRSLICDMVIHSQLVYKDLRFLDDINGQQYMHSFMPLLSPNQNYQWSVFSFYTICCIPLIWTDILSASLASISQLLVEGICVGSDAIKNQSSRDNHLLQKVLHVCNWTKNLTLASVFLSLQIIYLFAPIILAECEIYQLDKYCGAWKAFLHKSSVFATVAQIVWTFIVFSSVQERTVFVIKDKQQQLLQIVPLDSILMLVNGLVALFQQFCRLVQTCYHYVINLY